MNRWKDEKQGERPQTPLHGKQPQTKPGRNSKVEEKGEKPQTEADLERRPVPMVLSAAFPAAMGCLW